MRKLIPFILKLSVVLMICSVIGQQVRATKGDVERALELLGQARAAIGGESAINSIQNLSLKGKVRKLIQLPGQPERELNGEFEMSMVLPDRLMKMERLKFGEAGDARTPAIEGQEVKVRDFKVKVIRGEENAAMQNEMRQHEHAEIARYMLGLLLTPPPSLKAAYNYAGEGDVTGTRCDIIEVSGESGFALKLYLDKSSHLPLMMSYQGSLPRIPFNKIIRGDGPVNIEEDADENIHFRQQGEASEDAPDVIIIRKGKDNEAPAEGRKFTLPVPPPENAEIQIRFSDFRSVGGVLLPHTLTQTVNGQVDTIWTVEKYEINSPTINEKFSKEMHFRTKQN